MNDIKYHIALKKGDIGGYVILTGDPGRVPLIADYLDNPQEVARNREYVTYKGTADGIDIAVVSTGIGCPSTAICMEELAGIGVHTFIRVGTSGSLQKWVKNGDLVISTGAIRDEGTTLQYMPMTYPAVPDFDTVVALIESARKFGYSHHYGVTHCKDSFYSEVDQGLPLDEEHKKKWKMWEKAKVLSTSMEGSAIFVIATLKGLRSAEILATIGLTYDDQPIGDDKDRGVENAIKTTIEAIKYLDRKDKEKEAGKK